MSGFLFDTRKIKAYEALKKLCEYTGESQKWCDKLWKEFLEDADLFEEYRYYMEHHMLHDNMKCEGYSLIDLYVWQMNHDNLIHDTGKNTADCNKERMVLHAFEMMASMKKDPQTYINKLNQGKGMDQIG